MKKSLFIFAILLCVLNASMVSCEEKATPASTINYEVEINKKLQATQKDIESLQKYIQNTRAQLNQAEQQLLVAQGYYTSLKDLLNLKTTPPTED